jgi:hypothetical protein
MLPEANAAKSCFPEDRLSGDAPHPAHGSGSFGRADMQGTSGAPVTPAVKRRLAKFARCRTGSGRPTCP